SYFPCPLFLFFFAELPQTFVEYEHERFFHDLASYRMFRSFAMRASRFCGAMHVPIFKPLNSRSVAQIAGGIRESRRDIANRLIGTVAVAAGDSHLTERELIDAETFNSELERRGG